MAGSSFVGMISCSTFSPFWHVASGRRRSMPESATLMSSFMCFFKSSLSRNLLSQWLQWSQWLNFSLSSVVGSPGARTHPRARASSARNTKPRKKTPDGQVLNYANIREKILKRNIRGQEKFSEQNRRSRRAKD